MKAKKSLGQNFLTSIPARNAIVDAGELEKDDIVLEIGPGKGMLTASLIEKASRVIALEKDTDLIPYLNEHFKDAVISQKLNIILGDALTFIPPEGPYKLIANIPYYITGAIFSRYLSEVNQPKHMVVLIQKEVAMRIVAQDKKHSLLSLSVHVYGEPKIVYRVSRGSFHPIPNVDSAVLCIKNISKKRFQDEAHEKRFFEVLKLGFAHKRKFVIRNLEEGLEKERLHEAFVKRGLSEKSRAEDLTLEDWLFLALL